VWDSTFEAASLQLFFLDWGGGKTSTAGSDSRVSVQLTLPCLEPPSQMEEDK